jgi:hypothetical protein
MQHNTFTADQIALTYPKSHVHALHMQIYIRNLFTPVTVRLSLNFIIGSWGYTLHTEDRVS